jgi:hypothetical protein
MVIARHRDTIERYATEAFTCSPRACIEHVSALWMNVPIRVELWVDTLVSLRLRSPREPQHAKD